MKSVIFVALALVAVAAAAPVEEPVPILSSNYDQLPNGQYQYGYESGDGSKREEEGQVKQVTDEENKVHDVIVVRGSYSYIGPDGVPVFIKYVADEKGFNAEGDSIPKAVRR